jgi:hypothetical protein
VAFATFAQGENAVMISPVAGSLRCVAIGTVALVGPFLVNSADYGDWAVRNPLPTADYVRTVAYGNDRYVAAGLRTTILTSSDGLVWLERTLRTNAFKSIAFGNGLFVGAGYDGMSHSTNGLDWKLDHPMQFERVKRVNESFVAVAGSKIGISKDGIHWNTSTFADYFEFAGAAYGKGKYLAVGLYIPNPEKPPHRVVATSPDGTNWIALVSSNLPPMSAATFGNNVFVGLSGNRILNSQDGVTWTEEVIPGNPGFQDLVFANEMFVVVGERTAPYTSPDGRNWTLRDAGLDTASSQAITYGQGKFVAVGGVGGILISRDGVRWERRNRGSIPNLFSVAYLNGVFYCVGGGVGNASGSIYKSLDGINWSLQLFTNGAYFGGIAYGDGTYITGGSAGIILRSYDGNIWETENTGRALDVRQLIYAGGQFVAAAAGFRTGGILISPNGRNWTAPYTGDDNYMQGVTYGNGLYVAVGGDWLQAAAPGIIITSSDGTNWTRRTAGIQGVVTGIAYGKGLYVATL